MLAAGIGARFGGMKPLAPVGPDGEPLLLVSLHQAAAAGFARLVVVVSAATAQPVRDALTDAPLPWSLRYQPTPDGWSKPLGTLDAALAAGLDEDVVVVNGDDLYGASAFRTARRWLEDDPVEHAAAILYRIDRTLPVVVANTPRTSGLTQLAPLTEPHRGTGVSRAVADIGRDGCLIGLRERSGVVRDDDGTIRDSEGALVPDDSMVSMNLWCLRRPALAALQATRDRWVAEGVTAGERELGLPQAIDQLVVGGILTVAAHSTDSRWLGVTWPEDVDMVRTALRERRFENSGRDIEQR